VRVMAAETTDAVRRISRPGVVVHRALGGDAAGPMATLAQLLDVSLINQKRESSVCAVAQGTFDLHCVSGRLRRGDQSEHAHR